MSPVCVYISIYHICLFCSVIQSIFVSCFSLLNTCTHIHIHSVCHLITSSHSYCLSTPTTPEPWDLNTEQEPKDRSCICWQWLLTHAQARKLRVLHFLTLKRNNISHKLTSSVAEPQPLSTYMNDWLNKHKDMSPSGFSGLGVWVFSLVWLLLALRTAFFWTEAYISEICEIMFWLVSYHRLWAQC